jgi:hypothetical protein
MFVISTTRVWLGLRCDLARIFRRHEARAV